MRRAAQAGVLAGLCAAAAPLSAGMRADPVTACRFIVPDEIGNGAATWVGECPGHLAEGLGVIRVPQASGPPELFAGRMHAGQPVQGLVDLGEKASSDYGPAWKFEGAHAVYPTSQAQTDAGFLTASAGAAAASRLYASQGNAISAKFYAAWSQALTRAPRQSE